MSSDPLPPTAATKTGAGHETIRGESEDAQTTLQTLAQGFHKMELCLVDLSARTATMEGAVTRLVASLPDQQVMKELARVTSSTGVLEELVSKLVSSLPDKQVREELAKVNSDITSLGKSLAGVKTAQQSTVQEILAVTQKTHEAVQGGLQINDSTKLDTSTEMLSQINSSMKTLVNAVVSGASSLSGSPKTNSPSPEEGTIVREVKKCQIFTSSIGKDMDLKMMQDKLNISTEKSMVYSVERDEADDNAGNNLVETIKNKVKKDTEVIVIQCGSVNVTKAKTAEGASLVKKAAEIMVNIAEEASKTNDCEVFISQAPPRYDDRASGQGDLAKLTEFLNTTVRSACMFLPRVHTVHQGRLSASGKQLEARYQQDGLHLADAGSALLTKNIVEAISKTRPDLVLQEKIPAQPSRDSLQHTLSGGAAGENQGREEGGRGNRRPVRERGGRGGAGYGEDFRGRGRGDHWDTRQPPPGYNSQYRNGRW